MGSVADSAAALAVPVAVLGDGQTHAGHAWANVGTDPAVPVGVRIRVYPGRPGHGRSSESVRSGCRSVRAQGKGAVCGRSMGAQYRGAVNSQIGILVRADFRADFAVPVAVSGGSGCARCGPQAHSRASSRWVGPLARERGYAKHCATRYGLGGHAKASRPR